MTQTNQAKVLVLGATGMLGHAVLRFFASGGHYDTVGSARSAPGVRKLPAELQSRVIPGIDVQSFDDLTRLFEITRPDVVINCVGLVKQLQTAADPLATIPINALLPHRLARLCALVQARLLHVSTDCVFSGSKGSYCENDTPDAKDLYGRSKLLGEVDQPHAITLRTSIIGHELDSPHGLIGWFLSQREGVRGYTKAMFSGLPTVELARVMHDFVLPNPQLHGLYHVSATPISKYDLLRHVANVYGKTIDIAADGHVVLDRSLDSTRFRAATGYVPPPWPELVALMHRFG